MWVVEIDGLCLTDVDSHGNDDFRRGFVEKEAGEITLTLRDCEKGIDIVNFLETTTRAGNALHH